MNKQPVNVRKYESLKNDEKIILCDKCGNDNLEFMQTTIKYTSNEFICTYLKCNTCKACYLVDIYDYEAFNLKRDMLIVQDKINKIIKNNGNPAEGIIRLLQNRRIKLINKLKDNKNKYGIVFTKALQNLE